MKAQMLNVALIITALLLSIVALEVMIRLFDIDTGQKSVHTLHNVSTKNRLRFVPHSKALVETVEYRYIQSANSFGRRDIDWSTAMRSNTCNIILIGDSFVMGFGVADNWMLDRLLENYHSSDQTCVDQVFNFGMGGDVSTPEYKDLLVDALEIGIEARVLVVGVFVGNDFSRRPAVVSVTDAGERADVIGGVGLSHLWRSELLKLILNRLKNSTRLTGFLLRMGGFLGVRTYISPDAYIYQHEYSEEESAYIQETLHFLLDMKEMSEADGRTFYVVVFPNRIQVENYMDLDSVVYGAERPNQVIRAFCDKHRLRCFDLLPWLREYYQKHHKPLFYPIDRHLNRMGNEVAAKLIYEFLVSALPGPPAQGLRNRRE